MNLLKGTLCLSLFIIAVVRILIEQSQILIQKRHAETILVIVEALAIVASFVALEYAATSFEDQESTISNLKRTIRHIVQSKKRRKEGVKNDS